VPMFDDEDGDVRVTSGVILMSADALDRFLRYLQFEDTDRVL